MRRIKNCATAILLLLFAIFLYGCGDSNESFVELKGTEYTSKNNNEVNNYENPVLVVTDNGKSSLTYTYPGCDINFGSLSNVVDNGEEVATPVFEVTISTKTQPIGECVIDGNQYSIEYSKCLMSVTIEGNDREAYIEHAKKDCEQAFDQGEISKDEKEQYMSLLDGKVVNIYEGSVSKLVVSGTIDSTNNTMSMDSLAQYDTAGHLWQVSKYNSNGVIVYKERYNEAGVTVGVFENYDDGQKKSVTWYYDDGSFMSSEEYIVENGVKTKAIFKAEDGNIGTEYYKNGILSRLENIDSSGIETWIEYNEDGKEIKYTAITGGDGEYYNIGLFVLNPITEEFIELETTGYNNDGTVINSCSYTYDDNYNLIKVQISDSNGVIQTEERLDEQGRSIYWYSVDEEVIIVIQYDGEDYDRYCEIYTLDNTLKQVEKEKDGQVYIKSLQSDGTWREEIIDAN